MHDRQPVDDLLADDSVAESLKNRLQYVSQARQFAIQELGLPDNGSYTTYVDLGREYVSWAVFVAYPQRMELKQWCFWVVGCVPYRGYFTRQEAEDFARHWRSRRFDTYVVGVPAYSTLGWFADPLLSSMLNRGEISTVALLFHELAHQRLYVAGDTDFNESFAEAVKWIGLQRWLLERGQLQQMTQLWERQQYNNQATQLLADYRNRISEVYATYEDNWLAGIAERSRLYARLSEDLAVLTADWRNVLGIGSGGSYNRLNNALLLAYASYHDLTPYLLDAYRDCDEELMCFYGRMDYLAGLAREERLAVIKSGDYPATLLHN